MKKTLFLLCAGTALLLDAAVALRADFERNAGYLYSRGGKAKVVAVDDAHGGRKVMLFTAQEKKAVLTSGTMMSGQFASPRVRLSFFARGRGKINAGLSDGVYQGNGKYKYTSYPAKEEVELTGKWQKIEFVRDFAGSAPIGVYVRITLSAGGEAQIDDLLLETVSDPAVKVRAETADDIVRLGAPFPECRFAVTPKETPVVRLCIAPDRTFSVRSPEKAAMAGLYRVCATAAGETSEVRISVLPEKEYDAVTAAAQKVKFAKPVRILFLGDSIYDYNRGRNAADKVIRHLRRSNPGKITFRNAAVAGDFITRIEKRLSGKLSRAEQKKYENLFDRPYDLIFIAVGSNDNRTLRSDGYGKPLVPFAEQTQSMVRVIRFLKEKDPGARIILVSPSAPNRELQDRRAAAAEKGNYGFVKFGVPELTRQGIASQKQAAAAEKVEYLDLYDAMCQAAVPDFFARYDVIHLDEKGFNFLAQKILEYLANNKKEE